MICYHHYHHHPWHHHDSLSTSSNSHTFSSLCCFSELAVHDVVKVKVESDEDIWAIKVLNLLSAIQGFLCGTILAREIPIFGAPFGEDVFIVGLIDELRFDPDNYTIDLQELKTRKYKSPPSRSQQGQHRLQVMLYKKLFDDLVKGRVSKETVAKHLKLDLTKEFGEDVSKQIDGNLLTCKNLNDLMDMLLQKMQCLTCISQIGIEYVHQESKETICHHTMEYSDTELECTLKDYFQFWRGGRVVKGVDIEDAWKCQMCDFASVCDWRQRKAEEYSKKNTVKNGVVK